MSTRHLPRASWPKLLRTSDVYLACVGVVLAMTSMSATFADSLTATVQTIQGVPRLVVNGKPMAPRMFFGAPGSTPVDIPAGTSCQTFDFSPSQDAMGNGTVHIRPAHMPGTLLLERARLQDVTAQRDVVPESPLAGNPVWQFWPSNANDATGQINETPGDAGGTNLAITLHAPAAGPWSDTHVHTNENLTLLHGHRYRLQIWLSSDVARKINVAAYTVQNSRWEMIWGAGQPFDDQIKLAAHAGVNIVTFPINLPWPKPGEMPDFSNVDSVSRDILNANPSAMLIPRVDVDAPPWWLDAHPSEEMTWALPRPDAPRRATVSSLLYRSNAGANLAALIVHMDSVFGDHMLGYHPAGQNTNEWFYEDSWGPGLNGYAPADQIAFQKWLKARYAGNANLQNAWGDVAATIGTAATPSPAERRVNDIEFVVNQKVRDWNEFQQDQMADTVCYLAHVVKQATDSRKLCLFFYGYLYEVASMQNGPANSGHYALRRVLDCRDIDMLCSPLSYNDRGLGQSGPLMSAVDSDALAGKIYIAEDDTATDLSSGDAPGSVDRTTTVADTNKVLERNIAQVALRNIGTWWMDLGATGWFDNPAYWQLVSTFHPMVKEMLSNPYPFHPEVASVVDEDAMQLLAPQNRVAGPMSSSRIALGRLGAPYGQYLQDDVAAGKVHAKMYVFVSAWNLSAAERTALRSATRGTVRVWRYAPGYLDSGKPSLAAMGQLTGFQMKIVSPNTLSTTPTALGAKLGLSADAVPRQPLRPTFAVADATPNEILATFPDGSTAIAMRQLPDGISVFCGAPELTSELLRLAARAAKVHLFAQSNATVFANGPYLSVSATQDGPVVVNTGKTSATVNVANGKLIGKGPTFTLNMTKGDTVVMRY